MAGSCEQNPRRGPVLRGGKSEGDALGGGLALLGVGSEVGRTQWVGAGTEGSAVRAKEGSAKGHGERQAVNKKPGAAN